MILNIRVDYKTASISTMERSAQKLEGIFKDLQKHYSVKEHLQIKTCNRTEFYLVLDECKTPDIDCEEFMIETDEDAVKH
ncbi:MAG: glutamyl-tRNA reductase, partial [Methanobacterium paludis]|nr:glutamyl-tRNA reductase [Methanobacterium paludis]